MDLSILFHPGDQKDVHMKKSELMDQMTTWSAVFMRLSMHDFNHFARKNGLSLIQMNLLTHLFYRGPSEVMDFTDLMQVSPAGASQLVDRMATQGLVVRVEQPDDRRVRMVHLTDRGRSLVEGSIASRQKLMENLLESLSDEQEDMVLATLKLMTERAEQIENKPAE
jgi:DNA-binding MarR family transcriptional regulator